MPENAKWRQQLSRAISAEYWWICNVVDVDTSCACFGLFMHTDNFRKIAFLPAELTHGKAIFKKATLVMRRRFCSIMKMQSRRTHCKFPKTFYASPRSESGTQPYVTGWGSWYNSNTLQLNHDQLSQDSVIYSLFSSTPAMNSTLHTHCKYEQR